MQSCSGCNVTCVHVCWAGNVSSRPQVQHCCHTYISQQEMHGAYVLLCSALFGPLPPLPVCCCVQLVGICRTQLDEWAASEGPVDIAARGKDLSFEFSTQLLVSVESRGEGGGTCTAHPAKV